MKYLSLVSSQVFSFFSNKELFFSYNYKWISTTVEFVLHNCEPITKGKKKKKKQSQEKRQMKIIHKSSFIITNLKGGTNGSIVILYIYVIFSSFLSIYLLD